MNPTPEISVIVAAALDNGIGLNNQLLCHLSADLKRFKSLTLNHTVIMGRNTWYSLPFRPLKNRKNVVITDVDGESFEGAVVVGGIQEAIQVMDPDSENFIMGGASIYRQFLPLCSKIYLTRILEAFKADTFFPEIDPKIWHPVIIGETLTDQESGVKYRYETYFRP